MQRILQILKAVAAFLASIAVMDLTQVISLDLFPEGVAKWVALVPTSAAALLHIIIAIGDSLDDGVKNDSFWK